MQVNESQATAAVAANEEAGYKVSTGRTARTKFTGGESLAEGDYTPLNGDGNLTTAVEAPALRKGGDPYDALVFKCGEKSVKVGLSAIFNSVRVLQNAPADWKRGAKWQGKAAQPTKSFFRFGALSDMESGDRVVNGETVAFYAPKAFKLESTIYIVAPRFEAGNNAPIFDSQCEIRKVLAVKDYTNYPDAAAAE